LFTFTSLLVFTASVTQLLEGSTLRSRSIEQERPEPEPEEEIEEEIEEELEPEEEIEPEEEPEERSL